MSSCRSSERVSLPDFWHTTFIRRNKTTSDFTSIPAGNGVRGYEDVGIRIKGRSVEELFRSEGSSERYLHDNFKPGVKAGDYQTVGVPLYVLDENGIVELERFHEDIVIHPFDRGAGIKPVNESELARLTDEQTR